MSTPASDEQVEQLERKWLQSYPVALSGRIGSIVHHCARLHLAAVAEKDAEIKRLVSEEIQRIQHLNRLATWAQQDPTGPWHKEAIQAWVLNEIRAALGQENKPVGWQPETASLEQENKRLVEEYGAYRIGKQVNENALLLQLSTLRTHLRAVCEAAATMMNGSSYERVNISHLKQFDDALTAATPLLGKEEA